MITGVVQLGRQLGRQLGFPTANIALGEGHKPAYGVYAVCCRLEGRPSLDGVANVGVRPTLGLNSPLLEVHLFDFDEDIYGQVLQTHLVARLRDERRFDGLAELKGQLERDALQARDLLRDHRRREAAGLVARIAG
jgi:riboflavin kinase/FMN adenylyltransferase